MKNIKLLVIAAVSVLGIGLLMPVSVNALNPYQACNDSNVNSDLCSSQNGLADESAGGLIKNIVNALLFILGGISVIMIIIGGMRYVLSSGDPSSVKSAKDTILYAVIGLIVAIMAYAIVEWVVRVF